MEPMALATTETRLRVIAAIGLSLVAALLLSACGAGGGSSSPDEESGPLRASGGGSAQFRIPGGENILIKFGHEARQAELEQAAATVHGYLIARASKNWRAACSFSSHTFRELLKGDFELVHRFAGQSCGEMLRAIAPGEPPIAKTRYKATAVDAGSLRVEDGYGFLLFNAGPESRKLIVSRDDGDWKVTGLLPTPLY
jgi:hypothetical protein